MADLLIYALRDPRTFEIRYVGMSRKGMSRPLYHKRDSVLRSDSNLHKVRWIRGLQAEGLEYEVVVLERVEHAVDLATAEVKWISFGKAAGTLTNLTDGGDGGDTFSGRKHSTETRAKMRAARAKQDTSQYREKLSVRLKGRVFSDAAREKMSRAQRQRDWSYRKGQPKSAEHREKIAAALRGRKLSPEHREKVVNALARTREAKHAA